MNTAIILHEKIFGNIRYAAPEILKVKNIKQNPYTKYTDIYSLGVLFWVISSGQNPFEDQSDYTVIAAILSGRREERIKNTPDKYYELYSQCWNNEPEKRCAIDYVYNALKRLLENGNEKEIDNKKEIDDKKEIDNKKEINDKKIVDGKDEIDKGKINQNLYLIIVLMIFILKYFIQVITYVQEILKCFHLSN